MLYQRFDNVMGGFTGWVAAVASHPNVTMRYNKSHSFIDDNGYPRRYQRICFELGSKFVVLERQYRGERYAPVTDPMDPWRDNVTSLPGTISGTDLDPDTTTYPDKYLENYTEEEAAEVQSLYTYYFDNNAGIYTPVDQSTNGGTDLGIVDDNHQLFAVHVFADAQNLYIILEVEEGVFFHAYYTTDMVKHVSFGDTVFGGGTNHNASDSNPDGRNAPGSGYQYVGSNNGAWLYNEDLVWDERDPANGVYIYGGRMDYLFSSEALGPVFSMPSATTENGALYVAGVEFLPPGSDITHYGSYSIFGKAISIPFTAYYRYSGLPNRMYPLFTLNNVRSICMRGIGAKQEFTIDGQVWIAFPDVKIPVSWGGPSSSLITEWPDEQISTPMGVLIRKD